MVGGWKGRIFSQFFRVHDKWCMQISFENSYSQLTAVDHIYSATSFLDKIFTKEIMNPAKVCWGRLALLLFVSRKQQYANSCSWLV